MSDDERTRLWQRAEPVPAAPAREAIDSGERDPVAPAGDPLHALRSRIAAVRAAPRDREARRRLRAVAAEHGAWDQLAVLLADEVRAAGARAELAAAFHEELADAHENLDQPVDAIAAMERVVEAFPDAARVARLAALYGRAGAWQKAAEAHVRVSELAPDDVARAALHTAVELYREHARADAALDCARTIVERLPADVDAWRAVDELCAELGRWRECADARGKLAARARGVAKAAFLRAQARALEKAGDAGAAVALVAEASQHAPDDESGLVDYATVLARGGRGGEAAELLARRIDDAQLRGADDEAIAALRLRRAEILDEGGDRAGARAALDELLADAPDHVPALERLAAFAAKGGDPRAHATALLRYASALPEPATRAALAAEAARRFRAAADLPNAVRGFEEAIRASNDGALRDELDETRAALAVERALAAMRAGELDDAERRLRALVAARPHALAAHVALADLFAARGRLDDAAAHLRDALAGAPDDALPGDMARLVHRYARAVAAQGDRDEAHQLLHEAHRLDRKDLAITLALGDSCLQRRLWREAALHLGSLADHPDAPRRGADVAAALVRAAQAEVRALRPQNADKHYAAAVRLDPSCGPAWHALGEKAIGDGDFARAADCLEREARATTTPADRVRLWDALGDLARDVLGDPARAERCWRELVDAGDAGVLGKLLAAQRKRGAAGERGDTCERLAAITTDPRARAELLEEAASAHLASGDRARARTVVELLLREQPRDLDALAIAASVVDDDPPRVAGWLRRALPALADERSKRSFAGAIGSALGGQSSDELSAPRLADLWRRLGDAERALGDGAAAVAAYRRAVKTAPESDGALVARRAIVELAAGEGHSVTTSLVALVEAEQLPADVIAWARELAKTGARQGAIAAYELARALAVPLAPEDAAFVAQHAPRAMAADEAYGGPLSAEARRALIDDDDDAPLAELCAIVGEAAAVVAPDPRTALVDAGCADARRLTAIDPSAVGALYPQVANALGGPAVLLHAATGGNELMLLYAHPPVVVIGPRLAAHAEASPQLRYQLGRVVELSRPHRVLAAGVHPTDFARFARALERGFGPRAEAGDRDADALRGKLPVALRRRLTDALVSLGPLDDARYLAACARAADRAGLLACGDVAVAIAIAGGPDVGRHLVRLAASPRYLAARRQLRPRSR